METMTHCPDCGDLILPGDETTCKGEPLKTYYVTTVVKTTDISLGTIDGTANYLAWENGFRPAGCPDGQNDTGDLVASLWDNTWTFRKVSTEILP